MIKLEDLKLSDIMPPNLLRDTFVKAMCDALDVQLNKLVENNKKLSIYANIDNLPEEIINYLAWQLHVDFYDENWNIKQKRDAVKNSIKWHRYKGTVGVVEDYISTLFGGAKVFEWWEYGGEPYHFKIDLITTGITSEKDLEKIARAIYNIKNTRSWIDYLGFLKEHKINMQVGVIPSLHNKISVYPVTMSDATHEIKKNMGIVPTIDKYIKVYPMVNQNVTHNFNKNITAGVYLYKEVKIKCQTGQVE